MTVENSHLSELNLSQGNGTKLKSNLSVKSVNTEKSVNSVGLTRLRLIKIILQNKNRPNLFHNKMVGNKCGKVKVATKIDDCKSELFI